VETYSSIFDRVGQNQIDLCNKGTDEDDWEQHPYWDEVKFLEMGQLNWSQFPKEIFAIFWQLELQDISIPFDAYADVIKEVDS
jgi:hypothetical protein